MKKLLLLALAVYAVRWLDRRYPAALTSDDARLDTPTATPAQLPTYSPAYD